MGRVRKNYFPKVSSIVSPLPTNPTPETARCPQRDQENLPIPVEEQLAEEEVCEVEEVQSPTAHLPRQSVNEASKAGVYVDSLFTQSRLYEVTKPLISLIRKNISDAIARGYGGQINEDNSWSSDRISQFVEHVFSRIRSIFKIDSTDTSNSSMDTQMIERAAAYISALSKEGTNFVGNEYVKHHVIEALMPATVCSLRAISKRLDVNRQLLPKLIEKRRKFDKISMSAMDGPLSPAVAHQPDESLDDSFLAEQEGSFASNLQPDQLGLIHLFSGLGLSAEDDFFYSDNQTAPMSQCTRE